MRFSTSIILFLSMLIVLPLGASAQGNMFNQRDDEYRLLGLKRAKNAFEVARSDFERSRDLHKKGLISDRDLERSGNAFADAEVNYQQSVLSVIFEKQFVTVRSAVKYQGEDGYKHVRLQLENTSGASAELQKLSGIDPEALALLQPDLISNTYVSLLNGDAEIISQPYESKIAQLKFGEPVTLDFKLLQDLDAVTVNLIYGSGTTREVNIYLQKDNTVDRVAVQSEQFSQEVELGASASFDLSLELFSGLNNTYKLEVVNLPNQINRYFTDPVSQARLSQFKFTESVNTRRASLQIFLPDRQVDGVAMDESIPFYVMVIPNDRVGTIGPVAGRTWTQKEIEELNVGFVRLELIPRGVGQLYVRAPLLYYSIEEGDTVRVKYQIENEGSRRLDNIEITADAPLNWRKLNDPYLVPELEVGEEKEVELLFLAPDDVSSGKYELRVKASSFADNQPIYGEDKTITVEVMAKVNIAGTSIIMVLIVGVILTIVVFGVKLSKR